MGVLVARNLSAQLGRVSPRCLHDQGDPICTRPHLQAAHAQVAVAPVDVCFDRSWNPGKDEAAVVPDSPHEHRRHVHLVDGRAFRAGNQVSVRVDVDPLQAGQRPAPDA